MSQSFKILTTISRVGRLTLLITASWMSFFISCPAGNVPPDASQQSLFVNAPGSPLPVQDGPSDVLIADMNNDRKPDLVVAVGRSRSINVLEGKGNGQFGAALSNTTLTDAPNDMAVGDLNGD